MNDNKEIKKLSKTGEQSAEKVAGGKGINFEGLYLKDLTPIAVNPHPPRGMIEHPPRGMIETIFDCTDCGARIKLYSPMECCYYEGKRYCHSCLAKHKATAAEPTPSADAGLSN